MAKTAGEPTFEVAVLVIASALEVRTVSVAVWLTAAAMLPTAQVTIPLSLEQVPVAVAHDTNNIPAAFRSSVITTPTWLALVVLPAVSV